MSSETNSSSPGHLKFISRNTTKAKIALLKKGRETNKILLPKLPNLTIKQGSQQHGAASHESFCDLHNSSQI